MRPGAWSPGPRSSSPTSRPATSTPAPARRCWASCATRCAEFGQTIVMVTHDPNAASLRRPGGLPRPTARSSTSCVDPTAEAVLDQLKSLRRRRRTRGEPLMLRATLKSLLSRKLRLILSTGGGGARRHVRLRRTGAHRHAGPLVRRPVHRHLRDHRRPGHQGLRRDRGITGQPVPANHAGRRRGPVAGGRRASRRRRARSSSTAPGSSTRTARWSRPRGGPRFGGNWTGENALVDAAPGRGTGRGQRDRDQRQPGQDDRTSEVGDQIAVMTRLSRSRTVHARRHHRLHAAAGTRWPARRRSLFTEPVAQQLMLGETGVFNVIDVKVADGAVARPRCATASPPRSAPATRCKTGEELAPERLRRHQGRGCSSSTTCCSASPAVALFVGIFLILNTFSIIVAQRTRELALLRAMGASRRPGHRLGAHRGGRHRRCSPRCSGCCRASASGRCWAALARQLPQRRRAATGRPGGARRRRSSPRSRSGSGSP